MANDVSAIGGSETVFADLRRRKQTKNVRMNKSNNQFCTKTVFVEVKVQGQIQGGQGAQKPPLFLTKSMLFFYSVYNVWKIFLKLNFDFIVAEIRGVFFGSVGVYACVYVCVCVIP